MSIIRIKKTGNYTAVSNQPFNEASLSWEARGLLIYLLTKPDTWQIQQADLVKRGNAGRDKIQRMINELKVAGYIVSIIDRDISGKVTGRRYEVHETPVNSHNPENPVYGEKNHNPEKPSDGKPGVLVSNKRSLVSNNCLNKGAKKKTLVSESWTPSEKTIAWFKDQNPVFSLETMTEEFIDGCRAGGYKYLNHDSAFKNWTKRRLNNENSKLNKQNFESKPKPGAATLWSVCGGSINQNGN